MLLVLSPSKTLDLESVLPDVSVTQPRGLGEAGELVKILRNYSSAKLSQLMGISDKLSAMNVARFENFATPFTRNNARPVLFTFKGDVYAPMDISGYSKKELTFAQEHVRILSGLYGVLRPLDLMQAYRLEMGTSLKVKKAKDLYQFWGDKITGFLNDDLAKVKGGVLVNLASEEYFHSVKPKLLDGRLIHIVFKEKQKGALKIIGIHAKKARGMMDDYVIKQQLMDVEGLKKFTAGGYHFTPALSTAENWVFVR